MPEAPAYATGALLLRCSEIGPTRLWARGQGKWVGAVGSRQSGLGHGGYSSARFVCFQLAISGPVRLIGANARHVARAPPLAPPRRGGVEAAGVSGDKSDY